MQKLKGRCVFSKGRQFSIGSIPMKKIPVLKISQELRRQDQTCRLNLHVFCYRIKETELSHYAADYEAWHFSGISISCLPQ